MNVSVRVPARKSYFRQLVASAPIAMLLVDRNGSIVFGNEQAATLFGYAPDRLVGLPVENLIPQRYRADHVQQRRAFFENAGKRAMGAGRELFAQHRDGHEIAVEIGLAPIATAREVLTLVSMLDITERKRIEADVALQRAELVHMSRIATLSELASSLAHELNQPLTAILSNAQAGARFIARRPPDLAEVTISLQNVIDNAKRAGDVIRKLRSMLRKDRSEFLTLDINDVVRDTLLLVRSELIERRVEVVLELTPDLPPVHADRVQLQQVLLNLIGNAADAMHGMARGARVTLRTLLNARNAIEVQVVDAGTGIPEQDLNRIFTPFVTGKPGGMGLGLAVCTLIVQTHGGQLWATNNAGGGATLHVALPDGTRHASG